MVNKDWMTKKCLNPQYRGFLSVFGAFLIQLTAGTFHGTFGNLLPYFSSYVKKVRMVVIMKSLHTMNFRRIQK